MTAIKPSESLRVRGVPSTKYPTNRLCGHPDCNEPADGVHHCFPRSLIGNSSYFVAILDEDGDEAAPIPHAVGLCGSGTTGHHGDVEEHRAWIKLEDGEFVWYDRQDQTETDFPPRAPRPGDMTPSGDEAAGMWRSLGPLNPQPGSREGKPKRKRTIRGTTERAGRKTVSIRLPEGFDGKAWDDLLAVVQDRLFAEGLYDESVGDVAVGKLVVDGLNGYASC